MGFFNKINNRPSMLVNALKQISNRRDSKIFFTHVPKDGRLHSTNMCFTVSGSPRDWHVGGQ